MSRFRSLLGTRAARGALAAIFWLAAWQAVSLCAPKILFASPRRTVAALARLAGQGGFWLSVAHTLGKSALGFLLAFVSAVLLAAVAHRFLVAKTLLEPAVQLMKSLPVACFVVVALIWMPSAWISVLVAGFVVFPVTYINLQDGLSRLDRQLDEMAQVFRVPFAARLRYLYLPQVLPGVLSGCRVSVGMCWKAGIAGEIIGLPLHSIGEQLYLSKFYMAVDELFAWSLVIIAISLVLEKLIARALRYLRRKMEGGYGDPV